MRVPLNIWDYLERAAFVHGDRVAVVDEPGAPASLGRLTYAQLAARARGMATALDRMGVGDGARVAIVDLGPSSVQNVPANAAPGDTMTASGQVVQVGNYPILIADRISINNDIPLRVGRADNEYVDPARRPYEVSQEESATNPTCVGGGCEAGTVGRSTPRNPLSNAMSGDIGSEGR